MATHINSNIITQTSIQIRAWYSGSVTVYKCRFFISGDWEETDVIESGSTNWTTNWFTFSGLSPNTQYPFYVQFVDAEDNVIETSSVYYFRTLSPPVPAVPSSPYIDTSSSDGGYFERDGTAGLVLKWNSISGATKYTVKYRRGYDDYTLYSSPTTNSTRVYNLNFGTTYFISVRAGNDHGFSEYSSEAQGTTAPQTPSIFASNVTGHSIRINLGSMSGDWTRVEIYRRNLQGTLLGTATITKNGQQYVNYNITADSRFTARAFLVIGNTTIQSVNLSNEVVFTAMLKPENWAWSSNELNAFNNKGATSTVTYLRWNAFIDRVQEFVSYYNSKHGTSIPSVTSAKMTSSDKKLTASKFNTVRFAIGSMRATGINNVSTGDIVYGSYFTTLSNSLNNVD